MRLQILILVLLLPACATSSGQREAEGDEVKSVLKATTPELDSSLPTVLNTEKASFSEAEEPLSPGDWIHLSQAIDPKLNGDFNVLFDGTLKLPYEKTLTVQGMSVGELQDALKKLYQPLYQTPIRFDVSLGERKRWVELGGLVLRPGRYLVLHDANLDELIAASGGVHPSGSAKFAKIETESHVELINLQDYFDRGDDSGIPRWKGGERVTLLRESLEPPVHLIGEVHHPGEFPFRPGANFIYYLNQAAGPTHTANLGRIELIKNSNPSGPSIFFEATQESKTPSIEKGDTLIVHPDRPGLFDRTVQAMMALGGLSAAIATLVLIL